MKKSLIAKCLLIATVGSVGVIADTIVDKSDGVLRVTSDITGTVIAKVVGPNDEVIVDRRYEGNSFSWTPSGPDGAYRYDVHIVEAKAPNVEESDVEEQSDGSGASDYAGGSIEVIKGGIVINTGEGVLNEK